MLAKKGIVCYSDNRSTVSHFERLLYLYNSVSAKSNISGKYPNNNFITLHGIQDAGPEIRWMLDIPDQMSEFVNDYRILLVEARENDLVFHNHDNADLFQLLGILLTPDIPREEAKQKAIQYSEEHNTDSSVIMTVAGATGSNIDLNAFGKGDMKMCTFVKAIREEGREEGRTEGRAEEIIETGHEFGFGENEILDRLQKKLNISLQAAQEYFCRYAK